MTRRGFWQFLPCKVCGVRFEVRIHPRRKWHRVCCSPECSHENRRASCKEYDRKISGARSVVRWIYRVVTGRPLICGVATRHLVRHSMIGTGDPRSPKGWGYKS